MSNPMSKCKNQTCLQVNIKCIEKQWCHGQHSIGDGI